MVQQPQSLDISWVSCEQRYLTLIFTFLTCTMEYYLIIKKSEIQRYMLQEG